MPMTDAEIIRCPAALRAGAMGLLLSDLAPSQRREIAGPLLDDGAAVELSREPLFVALRDDRLSGAAWGQIQAGNIAVFWPPRLATGEQQQTADALATCVTRALDELAVEMTQVLLSTPDPEEIDLLKRAGFRHLADLMYLTWEATRIRTEGSASEIEFVEYEPSQRARLMALIERTYDGTLDCTALNGVRTMDDIVDGYEKTGVFRAANWLIVRGGGQDVGVLLLADHPGAGHWELMYMGLVPEARRRGWGRQITEHAQRMVHRAGVARIVAAVDATNSPAVRMYQEAGFNMWDRRTVYVRFFASAQP
jgi:ribosomal protein S18 acetylase RimI-like enzyme